MSDSGIHEKSSTRSNSGSESGQRNASNSSEHRGLREEDIQQVGRSHLDIKLWLEGQQNYVPDPPEQIQESDPQSAEADQLATANTHFSLVELHLEFVSAYKDMIDERISFVAQQAGTVKQGVDVEYCAIEVVLPKILDHCEKGNKSLLVAIESLIQGENALLSACDNKQSDGDKMHATLLKGYTINSHWGDLKDKWKDIFEKTGEFCLKVSPVEKETITRWQKVAQDWKEILEKANQRPMGKAS